jgi:hypothetical protein
VAAGAVEHADLQLVRSAKSRVRQAAQRRSNHVAVQG